MQSLFRPIPQHGHPRPPGAVPLAGGPLWFDRAERIDRGAGRRLVAASDIPAPTLDRLTAPRAPIAGLTWDRPRIMGILNVTPDSFSDGGLHAGPDAALAHAAAMIAQGADMIDVGGESTRPGAAYVPEDEEIARTRPVIAGLRARDPATAISIDTRRAAVARAALGAGAGLVNDVSGFTHDPGLAALVAEGLHPVCVMHMQGTPDTMQLDPAYEDVLVEVFDDLEARVAALEGRGLQRGRILVDPGIGFGKTVAHNLALLNGIALFHGLGCPILLGVSRKGFIGRIGGAPEAGARAPGSIAVALAALGQGVQMLRVHDVAETAQALALWQAVHHPQEVA